MKDSDMTTKPLPIVDFEDCYNCGTDTIHKDVIPLCPRCKEWWYGTTTEPWCPFCGQRIKLYESEV